MDKKTAFLIGLFFLTSISFLLLSKKEQRISELEQTLQSRATVGNQQESHVLQKSIIQRKSKREQVTEKTNHQPKYFIENTLEEKEEAHARISQQLQQSLGQIKEMYAPLYKELGLSQDEQKKLALSLVEIEELRAKAMETLRDLESRRASYDKKIQQVLSAENYKKYLAAELGRGPNKVIYDMQKSIHHSNLPELSKQQLSTIHRHLKEIEGGADFIGSFGPYGKLPTVAVGAKRIENRLSDRMSRLEGEKTYLMESIKNPATSSFIEQYYDSRILVAQKQLKQAKELETTLSLK